MRMYYIARKRAKINDFFDRIRGTPVPLTVNPVTEELEWPPPATQRPADELRESSTEHESLLDEESEEGDVSKAERGGTMGHRGGRRKSSTQDQQVEKTELELFCGDILCQFEMGLYERNRKLITVFGATGQQGGVVIRAMSAKQDFWLRGLTRDLNGKRAKVLRERGVEMVKVDLEDPSSIEAAIQNSYGVFLVTSFCGEGYPEKEKEIRLGETVAKACKKARVQHLVYSCQVPVKQLLVPCQHFKTKAAVQKYMIGLPSTGVRFSTYYETFAMKEMYQKMEDGSYKYTTYLQGPVDAVQGPLDAVSLEQCGNAVASIFGDPKKFIGKQVGLMEDQQTMKDYVAIIAAAMKKTINVDVVSDAALANHLADIGELDKFYMEKSVMRGQELQKGLLRAPETFEDWIDDNKHNLRT